LSYASKSLQSVEFVLLLQTQKNVKIFLIFRSTFFFI